jgi:hypothetical protein
MSFSKTGKVFPKEGNLLPVDGASYACGQGEMPAKPGTGRRQRAAAE